MSNKVNKTKSNMDNENSFSIPHVDNNGQLVINNIDPDMPCGKLEGVTEDEIVNKWLEENYPNLSQDQLEDMGVNVSFDEGNEEYILNGDVVTKEEYNEYKKNHETEEIKNGNDSHLKEYIGIGKNSDNSINVGSSHKEPGKIKITIDTKEFNKVLNDWMNQKITKEQADNINKIIEEKFGVVDAIKAGKAIKDSFKDISEILSKELGSTHTKVSITLIVVNLLIKPTMDALEFDNLLDADESELLRAIDAVSKVGALGASTVAMIVTTGGTAFIAATALSIAFTIIDFTIENYDDLDVFKFNEETGDIEWNFDMETADGQKINSHGTIDLNFESPQQLYNTVATYITTAKLEMLKDLDILLRKRPSFINNTKIKISDNMSNVTMDSSTKHLKSLAEIYSIKFLSKKFFYTDNSNYVINQNSESNNYKYILICNQVNGYLEYMIKKVSIENDWEINYSIYENYKKYQGEEIKNKIILEAKLITYEDIKVHANTYIPSYYHYYQLQNEESMNEFVDNLVLEDMVHTGEVGSLDEWNNISGYEKEANKNSTNFMSEDRIELAKDMVEQLYKKIMEKLDNYSNINEKIEEKEKEIVDLWKKVFPESGSK